MKLISIILLTILLISCTKQGTMRKLSGNNSDIEVYKYYFDDGEYVYISKFKDSELTTTSWQETQGTYLNNRIQDFANISLMTKTTPTVFKMIYRKGTYEIYKNNELKFEFNKRNTDSLSLETLKLIYEGD